MDMKLEVVVIPVSDVDRSKSFYGKLGWRLDADFADGKGWRVIDRQMRWIARAIGDFYDPTQPS